MTKAYNILKFCQFLSFPIAAFYIIESKELFQALNKLLPWVGKVSFYLGLYFNAFRHSSHKRSAAGFFTAVVKFVLMCLVAHLIIFVNKQQYEPSEILALVQRGDLNFMLIEVLPEIFFVLVVLFLGLAKVGYNTPFLYQFSLWPFYTFLGSTILQDVISWKQSYQATGFSLSDPHPMIVLGIQKYARNFHEPPMAILIINSLFFSFDWEILAVNIFDHVMAFVVGIVAMPTSYALALQLANLQSPTLSYSSTLVELYQRNIALVAILVVLSFHIHYSFEVSVLQLASIFGRKERVLESPFGKPDQSSSTLSHSAK